MLKYTTAAVVTLMFCTPALAEEPYVVLQYGDEEEDQAQHMVVSGETLYSILRRHFGTHANLVPLSQEVVRSNPHAFRDGDMGRMLAGKVLTLPTGDGGGSLSDVDDIYFF